MREYNPMDPGSDFLLRRKSLRRMEEKSGLKVKVLEWGQRFNSFCQLQRDGRSEEEYKGLSLNASAEKFLKIKKAVEVLSDDLQREKGSRKTSLKVQNRSSYMQVIRDKLEDQSHRRSW